MLNVQLIIAHKIFLDKIVFIELTKYLIKLIGAPFHADYDAIVFMLLCVWNQFLD